jgi:hypothetical protein
MMAEEIPTSVQASDYEGRDDGEKVTVTVGQLRRLIWYHDNYWNTKRAFEKQNKLMSEVLAHDQELYAKIISVDARIKSEQDQKGFWQITTAVSLVAFGIAAWLASN